MSGSRENPGRSQQELLRAFGIKPTRKRGQNFLIDGNMARAIAADVTSLSLDVLELGAGGGALTRPLLEAGARVTAVEIDRHLCKLLREELADQERFELFEADLAKLDWPDVLAKVGKRPVIAGNLPYVLTSEVLFAAADNRERIAGGVFMVQKEVAQRMVAEPGCKDYGILSILLGSLFDIHMIRQVPAQVFWPRPDVVSAVVCLVPRHGDSDSAVESTGDIWTDEEYFAFKDVIKTIFNQRRKAINTILKGRLDPDPGQLESFLESAGISPRQRPEDIPREALRKLARFLVGTEGS